MKPNQRTGITREDLERDDVRTRLLNTPLANLLLSDEQLAASMEAALRTAPTPGDLWLFAYGSLVWNPMVCFTERVPGRIFGYHRRFCLLSRINRGTPEQPGLVLALEKGGSCSGMLYRIPAAAKTKELRLLWRREMLMNSYVPRWLPARGDKGAVIPALAFVVNPRCSGYAGRLPETEIVRRLTQAHGLYGSGTDYLKATAAGLAASGLRCRHLETLVKQLAAHTNPAR